MQVNFTWKSLQYRGARFTRIFEQKFTQRFQVYIFQNWCIENSLFTRSEISLESNLREISLKSNLSWIINDKKTFKSGNPYLS